MSVFNREIFIKKLQRLKLHISNNWSNHYLDHIIIRINEYIKNDILFSLTQSFYVDFYLIELLTECLLKYIKNKFNKQESKHLITIFRNKNKICDGESKLHYIKKYQEHTSYNLFSYTIRFRNYYDFRVIIREKKTSNMWLDLYDDIRNDGYFKMLKRYEFYEKEIIETDNDGISIVKYDDIFKAIYLSLLSTRLRSMSTYLPEICIYRP